MGSAVVPVHLMPLRCDVFACQSWRRAHSVDADVLPRRRPVCLRHDGNPVGARALVCVTQRTGVCCHHGMASVPVCVYADDSLVLTV